MDRFRNCFKEELSWKLAGRWREMVIEREWSIYASNKVLFLVKNSPLVRSTRFLAEPTYKLKLVARREDPEEFNCLRGLSNNRIYVNFNLSLFLARRYKRTCAVSLAEPRQKRHKSAISKWKVSSLERERERERERKKAIPTGRFARNRRIQLLTEFHPTKIQMKKKRGERKREKRTRGLSFEERLNDS